MRIGASSEAATTPKVRPHPSVAAALVGLPDRSGKAGAIAERGDGDVLAQRQVGQDSLVLAILGQQADAGGDRVVRGSRL